MLQYNQHLNKSTLPLGMEDYAAGEVAQLDDMLDLPFVKECPGVLMVRFHPTDRSMANLVLFEAGKPRILAIMKGDIRATANIPEYIAQPIVDVPAFEPPADWGEPIPLDDLFASGLVQKG
jgi:hypothetical protein